MVKALSHGILLITLTILLNTSSSGATSVSVLKHFHGLNATIADHMIELEFLHSSRIGRMLADHDDSFVTLDALIDDEAVLKKCGRGKSYIRCLPLSNPKPIEDMCSTYKRGCPKPKA